MARPSFHIPGEPQSPPHPEVTRNLFIDSKNSTHKFYSKWYQPIFRIRRSASEVAIRQPQFASCSDQAVVRELCDRGLNQRTPVVVAAVLNGQGTVAVMRVNEFGDNGFSQDGALEAGARDRTDELKRVLNLTAAAGDRDFGPP